MDKLLNKYIDNNKQLYLPFDEYKKMDKYKLVTTIIKKIKDKKIDFPYKKYFVDDPNIIFKLLINHKMTYDTNEAPPFDEVFNSDKYGTMLILDEDYKIDLLSDIFQENIRIRANKKNKASPLQDWINRSSKIVIENIIKNKYDINPENLREKLYELKGNQLECTQFKPTVAKELYNSFNSINVLDFSAGWGDRLLGAIASKSVESYTAFDPNKALKKGHDSMISTFCPLNKKKPENFKIEYIGFENANLNDKKFDTIFTSPPFFDFEVYSQDKDQSILLHPTFISWIKDFLFKSIDKCWDVLTENGIFSIYIGDTPGSNPTIPMNIYIHEKFKDSEYLGSTCYAQLGKNNHIGKRRYIFIWKKNKNVIKKSLKYMEKDYPDIFN